MERLETKARIEEVVPPPPNTGIYVFTTLWTERLCRYELKFIFMCFMIEADVVTLSFIVV